MSAIASFILLPTERLAGLRAAATPIKRLFRAPVDLYPDYVRQYGREVVEYEPSGWILPALLSYLDEQGIHLTNSSEDELAAYLCEARHEPVFIFTPAHNTAYYDRLSASLFSADALNAYYNEYNEEDETEIGELMLDGISSIQQSLAALDADSVILFSIG